MKLIFSLIFSLVVIFGAVDYNTEIQPIFNANCGNCHLGNSSGGVNLSSYENTMSSDVITPESHQQSVLWNEVNTGDMPAGNNSALSDEEIDLISQWIDEGALEFPENECDEGYTYFEDYPINTCIVLDGSQCFYNDDVEALQDIITLNGLQDSHDNSLFL